jgi:3',5'-cyclic AMP phosphodiesterase CpdA
VLIAQVTDTHVACDGREAAFLAEAIAWINAMQPRPEAVLVSGDIVDHGRREQYVVLRGLLARCAPAVYVVPGNHDAREALRDVLPDAYFPGVTGARLDYAVATHAVRIIGLDTSEQRRPGGILRADALDWLDRCLNAAPAQPTLLFMHHPPFRTGVNAADLFGFRGLRNFRTIVERHPAVRRIIAGHIHCVRQAEIGAASASTSISSAPQRVPELFERGHILSSRAEPGGFTTHEWRAGAFVSTTYVNTGGGRFAAQTGG